MDRAVDMIWSASIPRRMALGSTAASRPGVINWGLAIGFETRRVFGFESGLQFGHLLFQSCDVGSKGINFLVSPPYLMAVAVTIAVRIANQFIGPSRGDAIQVRAGVTVGTLVALGSFSISAHWIFAWLSGK